MSRPRLFAFALRRGSLLGLLVLVLASPLLAQTQQLSCTVCHPGALTSSRRSVHEPLVQKHGTDASCLQCHGDALAHQASPRDAKTRPGSARSSCVRCHEGRTFTNPQVRLASHPSRALLRETEERLRIREEAKEAGGLGVPDPQPDESLLALSGLIRVGWRLADVRGDERAFESDFGIDEGPKLLSSELTLRGPGGAVYARGGLHGVGERRTTANFETGDGLSRSVGLDFAFSRHRYVYDRDGDFHSVSSRIDRYALTGSWWLDDEQDTRVYLGWDRRHREGQTVTSRIGNANQVPLEPATSVPAVRQWRGDDWKAGLETRVRGGTLRLEAAWRVERIREQLSYSRPSPANAAFTEQEVDRQDSSRRGPVAEASYAHKSEGSRGETVLRGEWLDTRYVEGGSLDAYDTSAFTVDSTANATGEARRLTVLQRDEWDLWEGAAFEFQFLWQDLKEDNHLRSWDTTTRGSLVTVAPRDLRLRTRFSEHEFTAGLRQAISGPWEVYGGYLYGKQHLELPDFEAGDADYRSGNLTLHGPYLGLDGGFGEHWTFRADARIDDTGGRTPTETQLESGYRFRFRLRRALEEDSYLQAFASYRNLENDLSSTKRIQESYGASLSVSPWRDALLGASASWNRTDARTLSTFYYAPSTSPVPTIVGYVGENTIAEVSLEAPLHERLRFRSFVALSYSTGSLRSSLWWTENELVYDVLENASLGLALQFYRYDDRSPGLDDDYEADVLMLFGEMRF